jgi:hypothetical protein
MRCNNCGWNNADDVTHCVKCNNPLEEARGVRQEKETVRGARPEPEPNGLRQATVAGRQEERPAAGPGQGERYAEGLGQGERHGEGPGHAETLRGARADGELPMELPAELIACPACHYPASSRVETCPNCGSPLKPGGAARSARVAPAGELTVDPFRQPQATEAPPPTMFLERVGRPEEASKVLPFTAVDDQVAVNRQTLDENNFTITSRLQAAFVFTDNKWWLLDKSDLKTTFIQVKEPVEMKDGDIVLMGDRRFVFYSTSPGAGGEGTV